METVILACSTLRDELEQAIRETSSPHPVVWIDSGLHNVPKNLHQSLKEELSRLGGVGRALLAFGFCGNAVLDLETGDFELVIPRADDCITLLLGSEEARVRAQSDGGVYFLTKGWLKGEHNIWKEYRTVLARYGQARTERVYKTILAHYRYLGLIDTGAYDVEEILPEVREMAGDLKLDTRLMEGDGGFMRRLLTGPWAREEFLVVPPRSRIGLEDLASGGRNFSQTGATPFQGGGG